MNIQLVVKEGINILKNSHIKTAQLDTEVLMAETLGATREYILLNTHKNLNDKDIDYFRRLIIIDKNSNYFIAKNINLFIGVLNVFL